MYNKICLHKIFYTVVMLILSAIFFLMFLWTNIINNHSKNANHFIGIKAITFDLKDIDNTSSKDVEKVYKVIDDCAICTIKDEIENDVTIIQMFLRGDVDTPQVKKGRFFNEDDDIHEKYAVIGVNILESNMIRESNEKKYYDFEDESYEIIGILKDNDETMNNDVFLSINDFDKIKDKELIIDGKCKDDIIRNLKNIKKFIDIEEKPTSKNMLENSINNLKQQKNIILGTMVFVIVFGVIINKLYNKRIKSEMEIKMIIGITNKMILKENYKFIFMVFLLAYAIITVMAGGIRLIYKEVSILKVLSNTYVLMTVLLVVSIIDVNITSAYASKDICKNSV